MPVFSLDFLCFEKIIVFINYINFINLFLNKLINVIQIFILICNKYQETYINKGFLGIFNTLKQCKRVLRPKSLRNTALEFFCMKEGTFTCEQYHILSLLAGCVYGNPPLTPSTSVFSHAASPCPTFHTCKGGCCQLTLA